MGKFLERLLYFTALFTACVFYIGYIPFAPGTWGSLFGLLTLLLPSYFFPLLLIIGTLSCFKIVDYKKDTDPSWIVIDEVLGVYLAILMVQNFYKIDALRIVLIFLSFRFFDIVKPFPIRNIENFFKKSKIYAPLGVIVDDLIAGIFSFITVCLFSYYIPETMVQTFQDRVVRLF